MFTDRAQSIIDQAKDHAFAHAKSSLDLVSLLAVMGENAEARVRLAQCLTKGDVVKLRELCPPLEQTASCPSPMDLSAEFQNLLNTALDLASGRGVPDIFHPGLIDLRHLICATAMSLQACTLLKGLPPLTREQALSLLSAWYEDPGRDNSLGGLVNQLRQLRSELLAKVFGQDHAIHTFVEGLYNSEITAQADRERKSPAAIFVFAGPPGVGKTYLAETSASLLKRPFKRFDMTAYADHQDHAQLVGFAKAYKGAKLGQLTEFVQKNPQAILLFDEIEKAHLNTIQLFYQILDAGGLEDKHEEVQVSFRDTVIIFTTNAGKSLYDDPNHSGIGVANAGYHRRTILSALESEKNPASGKPVFPQAICSRIAQGYPVMFNHLGVNELERICAQEIVRTEMLMEHQYFKSICHDKLLPMALVYREGGRCDARQLRSEAGKFLKTELFKYSSLYSESKLEDILDGIDRIRFEIELADEATQSEVTALFRSVDKPKVLLIASSEFAEVCSRLIPDIDWACASTIAEVVSLISSEDLDLALLDVWLGAEEAQAASQQGLSDSIHEQQDSVPLSARALDLGRNILSLINRRAPQIPVYLLSLEDEAEDGSKTGGLKQSTVYVDGGRDGRQPNGGGKRRPVDNELFMACVRAGGARGLLATEFRGDGRLNWMLQRDQFVLSLSEICHRLYLERQVADLAKSHKVLSFEVSGRLDEPRRELCINLRSFRLTRTLDAQDVGEMVEDVERPITRLDDVIGAKSAKESVGFLLDWLKNPRAYAALGLRAPKGIMLTGHPGTGKTMLARALAGESKCAYLEKSATSFVTVWQGSGPQNVRDLFARARRYAPTVVFIDEIDAIGTKRGSGSGSDRTREDTLNALLTEMDGFRAQSNQPVITLAATNLVDRLDPALLRRFDRVIEVERPDRKARLEYLVKATQGRRGGQISSSVLERLAAQSVGLSIADLERIIHQAGILAVQFGEPLTGALLEEAHERFILGDARTSTDQSRLLRTARHEAGHAVIAWLGGTPIAQVTIVGRGNTGGRMVREVDEEQGTYNKLQLEQLIREAMGGRCAELLYYGDQEGLSTGSSSDLQQATGMASRMAAEFGMSQELGPVALPARLWQGDGVVGLQVLEAARGIISEQQTRTLELLQQNRQHLDRLVSELMDKNRLTHEDLTRIFSKLDSTAQ